MSEQHVKLSTSNAQEEGDLLTMVKKIQQHLVYLEKKIDMLVSQSSGGGSRPSFGGGGGRPFNKRPFKPRFERSGQGGGEREQRDFSGGGPRFDRGPRDRDRGGDRGERREGGFGGRNKKPWGRRER